MPQLIIGIILLIVAFHLITTYWVLILMVAVGSVISYFTINFVNEKIKENQTEEKQKFYDKIALWLFPISIIFIIYFSGLYWYNHYDKHVIDAQIAEQKRIEQEKLDEQKQIEKAKLESEKLQKNIERANNLTGEEKNFYDSKFQEYINSGQDENSSREKALADLDDMLKKQEYEKKRAEDIEKTRLQQEKLKAAQAEREKNYLANNYNEIYQWCYWMFYKIGYSDDALQYHMSNGDAESMRDLNFLMNKFSSDVQTGQYSINSNIPEDIKNIMSNARNNLQKSFMLRKNGNRSEIQQSNQIENEVIQQLIQIQSMLPEGVKYWSYQGIYDPNDELDIPQEYKNNEKNFEDADRVHLSW